MLLAKVEKHRAEAVRRALFARDIVRKDLAILEERDSILIPLKENLDAATIRELDLVLVEGKSHPRTFYRSPYEEIRDRVDIPDSLKSRLPDKWEKLGDVLILRLPPELDKYEAQIAEVYARVLRAKAVCREIGIITGPYREPNLKVILGDETETVHIENGIKYKFDVARIMFSSGNINERKRMSELECDGETVIDMFAGIGYFTLPIAVYTKAKKIVACEINPLSYRYLEENIRLNHVDSKVTAFLGDNRNLPGKGIADRIIMGYVGTTHHYLPKALELIKPSGIIHYHETCPINLFPEQPMRRIDDAMHGRRYEILSIREVKSYGPSTIHVVVDIRVLE
ncbi:MAG: class I SAM-dependent methyltransferase family protein [Methanomassiliicoccales archaeon]|jgi:tRNA wybutosine-synthesizing protein 2|nr:class I SAM-dependent methyltransferase family protein [Methanomassiliicoccales archaeon]